MAWERVAEGIKEREGRAGCLIGNVEDYVQSLDEAIAMKDAAFEKNRQVIQQRIESSNSDIKNLMSTMRDQA